MPLFPPCPLSLCFLPPCPSLSSSSLFSPSLSSSKSFLRPPAHHHRLRRPRPRHPHPHPHPHPQTQTQTQTLLTAALSTSPPQQVFKDSLALLDWPAVSAHLRRHVHTPQARAVLVDSVPIPPTRALSEALLTLTRAAHALPAPLDLSLVADVGPLAVLAAKNAVLSPSELRSIADTLAAARAIHRLLDTIEDPRILPLQQLTASLRTHPQIHNAIVRAIDDQAVVIDTFDPQLRAIRDDLRNVTADISHQLNALMTRHGDSVHHRVITTRYDRLVIPVKTANKGVFKRAIIHDLSASGATTYLEPAVVRPLNDRLRMLAAREKARVYKILRELCDLVAPIQPDIAHLSDILSQIDLACARAAVARELRARDVVFDDSVPLRLVGVRHPLLSWEAMAVCNSPQRQEQQKQQQQHLPNNNRPPWMDLVVPSSYLLPHHVRCVSITGPNTGGKTLALKTLGVAVLMAKAGMFVPSSAPSPLNSQPDDHLTATIPYFDNVLVDIGDDQSLVQSLSTFSGHVERIKRILAASTSKSLVLLDEIGSGTDPEEGAALGMAILRNLAIGKHAALTFATTHHGELKTLKYSKDDSARYFENACVEFDDVNMKPTYKLVWGIPGRSNALAIAERLGLDPTVIEEARFLLNGSGEHENGTSARVDIDKMISSLEQDKNAAENAREDSERAFHEMDMMRKELETRLNRLRENEIKLRNDQRTAMEVEVHEAKKKIAKVIKDMQQGGGSAQAANLATDRLVKLRVPGTVPGWNVSMPEKPVDVNDIRTGDKVIVPRLGPNEMKVMEKVGKKELMVSIGAMRAKVKVKEIAWVRGASQVKEKSTQRESSPVTLMPTDVKRKQIAVRTSANTVDVRGDTVDTAEPKVDRALDKALAMGTLWVIHGHGTGRLRNGLRQFLSAHELVERIEDAEQVDGGTGVTIAYLQ